MKTTTEWIWDRHLWAVELWDRHGKRDGLIVSQLWDQAFHPRYTGEPIHCLLFETSKQARAWYRQAEESARSHSPDWRFRPVRVRETIVPEPTTP